MDVRHLSFYFILRIKIELPTFRKKHLNQVSFLAETNINVFLYPDFDKRVSKSFYTFSFPFRHCTVVLHTAIEKS